MFNLLKTSYKEKMNNYDNHEEEINIFTLLWFVLSKWKSILIVAVIGLVIGAGYVAVSSTNNTEVSDATEVEENMSSIAAKQTYNSSLKRVESLEKFIAEAAIMELNPYKLYKGTVVYVIDGVYKDFPVINTSIKSFVWDGALMADIQKAGPYTSVELEYLLSLLQETSSQFIVDENSIGQVTARIGICAKDKNEAQNMLIQIDNSMKAYLDTMMLEQTIMRYELISMDYREMVSTTLADYQTSIYNKYSTEKANLTTYYEKINAVTTTENVVLEDAVNKTMLVKYGGLGFISGFLLAIVIWILFYFLCGKLYKVSNKGSRFGVKQLGTICDYSQLRGLDLWIAHRLSGIYSYLPTEEQKNIVLSNIKNELTKNASIKKLFLVSSLGDNVDLKYGLRKELESAGYHIVGVDSVIGRSETLKHLACSDAAIIIEDNHKSKVTLIEEEMNILMEYVNTVLGMVIVQDK